jgi:hypothetical protein
MATLTFTRLITGMYRAEVGADAIGREVYAIIKKHPDGWHADFRYWSCHEICRFAGIWSSLRDAKEEVAHITDHSFGYKPFRLTHASMTRRGILATEG